MAHPFLSPEWIAAAREIRAEYADRIPDPDVPMRANVVVKDMPFGASELAGYVDTSDGSLLLEEGSLEDPELTVTLDYGTAKALFVTQDMGKIMEAFLGGKILVTGDVSRILTLAPPTDPEQLELATELAGRIDAITLDETDPSVDESQ